MTQPAVLVAGRYRLEERIGIGAMGVVWRAVDERLGRQVAIKQLVVPPGLADSGGDEAKQRIRREARLAARLHHPNAVAVFDVVDHEDRPWLVMEYLPSRSLATVLAEHGPLSPIEVADIGRQLADGLAAAHAAGIVHRDVKPGNVLLAEDGTVKLTDFGISHAADDVTLTRTGVLAGTPAYLAPEVARGAYPTAASDVFALGATLYTAVEGQPPFGLNDNALALLHQVAAGVVRPPRQAGPLTALLMRLLRAEPAERPTMGRVSGMLATVLAGRPVSEPLSGPAAPAGIAAWAVPVSWPDSRPDSGSGSRHDFRPGFPPGSHPGPQPAPTKVGLPPILALREEPARSAGPARQFRLIALVTALLVLTGLLVYAATRKTKGPSANPPTTGAGPSATSVAPTAPPPSATELQQVVSEYYGLLPRELERAWPRLGPGLQALGYDSYQRFWKQFESVQADVLEADPATMTVRVVVVFRRKDQRPTAELHNLTLIRGDSGQLLIDADRRLGATNFPGNIDKKGEGGNGDNGGNGRGGG